ncbi:hypothetical protein BAUCODRAFT_145133 [Baudoinia panamericana UAMH 10762]|uniref:Chromo domain-containing protein n=1 Tax=Baudoinia panamericana (strain UAMH 10762) TaxID=717646 RepID=M2LYG3_BAUPA|nr:uncharacterized protein BAUCODRAFT_145133 [Baudoinia panamericana UAMH 10762]EMC99752.1 hypothetical protein BAUCODRAFT_145133 [Baudoinia panamericana UAMH 10762]
MPPALSDDEFDDDDDVPDQIPARQTAKLEPKLPDVDDEDGEEDEAGEEEYRVEKIVAHGFEEDGSVKYKIKWLGYDNEDDMTWEPVENLEGAQDALKAYHKKIGGPPQLPSAMLKKGKGGKRTAEQAFDSPAQASSGKKRGRKSANGTAEEPVERSRQLPIGSWDDHVLRVASIIEEALETHTSKGVKVENRELIGLLMWKDNGPKTQHKMNILRTKCPQRLLDYYEQHLRFTD